MNQSFEAAKTNTRFLNLTEYQQGMLFITLVSILSSAGWVFTKIALKEIDPLAFIAWRFLLAAFILLPFCFSQLRSFTRHHWVNSVKAGFFLALALSIWVEGMNKIENIGEAAFIISLAVVFVPVISAFLGDKLSIFLWISLIPALLGLYLLTGANGFYLNHAQLILLLASFLFSCHVVFSARHTKGIPSLGLTVVQLFMVALLTLVVSSFQGTVAHIFIDQISPLGWAMFLCSAIIATSMRFGLQTKALTMIPAQEASMLSSLAPVFTAFLGWWVLGENMSLIQLAGCVLIFLAQPIYRYGQSKIQVVKTTLN